MDDKSLNGKKVLDSGCGPGRYIDVILNKDPEKVLRLAVKGMLPKNRLGRQLFNNLYVYAGTEHPHEAQQPKEIKF